MAQEPQTITIWARPKEGQEREWKAIAQIPPDDLSEAYQKRRSDYEYKTTFGEKPEE